MHTRRTLLQLGARAPWAAAWASPNNAKHVLSSPNKRVEITVHPDAKGISLAVAWDGKPLLRCSRLGLDLAEGGPLSANLRVVEAARSTVTDDYALVCGKTRHVREECRQLVLDCVEAGAGRKLQLAIRAYDGGVAFRVRMPAQDRPVSVKAELTQFDFPGDTVCWGANLGAFDTSHEHEFEPVRASGLKPGDLFDAPLVCATGHGGVTFALAEAGVENYPALYFARQDSGAPGVKITLSPRLGHPETAIVSPPGAAVASPWRVVLIGDHPGRLIESTLMTTLSAASRVADTSWIKPGKAAWDWWSDPDPGASGPRMTDATMKRLIDFAAATNLQYLLIDGGWYADPDGKAVWPDVDITRSVPAIHLPELVEYGQQRGIGIFVWMRWSHLAAQMPAALKYYRETGVKGIKVDYFNRDDQEMVALTHELLAQAAADRLMVDMHGVSHGTGLQRTYPNLVTQEGVMGAEYNKWTKRVTSLHNVTLPFTRMLLAPMDYTPGGFRNVTPEQFAPHEDAPLVQTTRGQALAMYVVFDSPFACVSDSPAGYKDQPGVDFLAMVPTSWDETRVLDGRIGEFITIARRSGKAWFIGAMTNPAERTISVPLGFLGEGRFAVVIYEDGDTPEAITIQRNRAVTRDAVLEVKLASNGGAAIAIVPTG